MLHSSSRQHEEQVTCLWAAYIHNSVTRHGLRTYTAITPTKHVRLRFRRLRVGIMSLGLRNWSLEYAVVKLGIAESLRAEFCETRVMKSHLFHMLNIDYKLVLGCNPDEGNQANLALAIPVREAGLAEGAP